MEASSATTEMLKKADAGGAKRHRHEELGSEGVVEAAKRQRAADAPLQDPEDDGSVSQWSGSVRQGGGERRQLVKLCGLSPMPPLQRLLNACRRALFTGSSCCTPPTATAVAFVRGVMDKIGPDDIGHKDEVRFFNRMNTAGRTEGVRDHDVAAAASGAWVLFPNHGGNMHRFTAAEDAHCAFLDVLTPPMDQRRCAYYQDLEFRPSDYEHHRPGCRSSAGAVSFDGLTTEEQTRRLAWLEEAPQPRELRIVCLPYRGPTIF